MTTNLNEIVPPSAPNDGATFSSLRDAAAHHVQLVTGFSPEPRRHADIMAMVNAAYELAERELDDQLASPVTPAGRDRLDGARARARDRARAYGELAAALHASCGSSCTKIPDA